MGDIGKVAPGFHNHEETTIWRCPIAVLDADTSESFKIVSIYEDEGILCIDILSTKKPNDE